MKKCLENGISTIRILQDDVWNDKNNWEEHLIKCIKKYDTPEIVFICENNDYEFHNVE